MTNQPNAYGAPISGLWPAGQLHPSDLTFGEEPIASFRLILDTSWIACAHERWRRARRPISAWLAAVLVAIPLGLFLYFVVAKNEPGNTRAFVALLAGTCGALGTATFLFLTRRAATQATVHNFRQSKDFETVHSVMFYREEFVTLGPTGVSARRWNAISSSRCFKDGILILPDPYHFHWLPWTNVVSGTVEDLNAILRANVVDHQDLRV